RSLPRSSAHRAFRFEFVIEVMMVDALLLAADDDEAASDSDHLDRRTVEAGQGLGGHHLGGGADEEMPADDVEDSVDVGKDRVDLVGDEDDGGVALDPLF